MIEDADLSKVNPWVAENVVPYLRLDEMPEDWDPEFDLYVVVPRAEAGAVIKAWVDNVLDERRREIRRRYGARPSKIDPIFWADYADYDWVLLCQLFGTMLDRPEGWPMFCRDIQQMKLDVEYGAKLPEPEGQAHRALDDAENVEQRWLILDRHREASAMYEDPEW